MREYIGKRLKIVVDGVGVVKGTVVDDQKCFLFVKGETGTARIVKSKISMFMPESEPEKYVPFLVLFCENKTTGCAGVRMPLEGEGFKKSDLDVFMEPCPSRCDTCRCGSKGELRTVNPDVLRSMLTGTLFGDYPEKKGNRNAGTGKTGSGKKQDTSIDGRKKQAGGGTDGPSETERGIGEKMP